MIEPFTEVKDRVRRYVYPELSLDGENLGSGWRRRWWSLDDEWIDEFLDTVFQDIAPGECRKFLSDEGVRNATDF